MNEISNTTEPQIAHSECYAQVFSRLFFGDCLEIMPQIESNSVDMVLCDLPYEVTQNKDDIMIDPEKLWEQYWRIAKPNAPIVLFGQDKFTAVMMLSDKNHKYNLIWDKVGKTCFLNANKMPMRQHEDILVFYKKLCTYNPQMEKCEPHKRNHGKGKNEAPTNSCYGKFVSTPTIISDEKFHSQQ